MTEGGGGRRGRALDSRLRRVGVALACVLLVGGCASAWAAHTLFLTLPDDGERALIERVARDHCGGRRCAEVQMYNLSRTGGGKLWCINLAIYLEARATTPRAESYMMYRSAQGTWHMDPIPGSICDTWSLSGRRHIVDRREHC